MMVVATGQGCSEDDAGNDDAPSATDDSVNHSRADEGNAEALSNENADDAASMDDAVQPAVPDQAWTSSIGVLSFEPLEIDEVSAVGFSPQQAADALAGEHKAMLRYESAFLDAGMPESEFTVHVEPTFEPLGRGVSYDFGDEVAVLVPFEPPQIWFTAKISVRTQDGTFDETATATVRASSLEEGYASVGIALQDVEGSYESNPPDCAPPTDDFGADDDWAEACPVGEGHLRFTTYVREDGTTEGRVMDEDLIGLEQSAVVARWGATE